MQRADHSDHENALSFGTQLSELFLIDHHNGCTYPRPSPNRATTAASRMDRTRR